MKAFFYHFFLGLFCLPKGCWLFLTFKGIKRHVFTPILIYTLILSGGLWTGIKVLPPLLEKFATTLTLPLLGDFGASLFTHILGWIIYAFVLALAFLISANLIAAPFNSMMAEKICLHEHIISDEKFHLWDWIRKAWRMLKVSIFKSLLFVLMSFALMLLSFIPGLQPLAPTGVFLMLAYDSMDYAFEIKQWGLRKRFHFFIRNFSVFVGIAICLGVTFVVPGLIFVTYPLFIAGSTKIFCQILKSQPLPPIMSR